MVGGVDAHILDYPYMAGIHVDFRDQGFLPFCGSTIISRRSVLTVSFDLLQLHEMFSSFLNFQAAHCLEYDWRQVTAGEVLVSVGSSYRLGTRALWYSPFRLIRHPAYFYDGMNINADIAIVRLLMPIVYSPVARPISLGSFFVNSDERVTVTGAKFSL